jgi:hypothetical protein
MSGKDAAAAGAVMLAVNLLCAGVGLGLGALAGAPVPGLLIGFCIGFFLAIAFVIRAFRAP